MHLVEETWSVTGEKKSHICTLKEKPETNLETVGPVNYINAHDNPAYWSKTVC